jgi:hypothetical protein
MSDLVRVVSPETEAELAAIVELLEAHEVPCFVCDTRLSWVPSGVQGGVRKPQVVMVPGCLVAEAAALIGSLKSSRAACNDVTRKLFPSRLRALVRLIWFGWCRPVVRNFK